MWIRGLRGNHHVSRMLEDTCHDLLLYNFLWLCPATIIKIKLFKAIKILRVATGSSAEKESEILVSKLCVVARAIGAGAGAAQCQM